MVRPMVGVGGSIETQPGDREGSDAGELELKKRATASLTGARGVGTPMLFILGTNEGRYEQHLVNTLGPIELWALSTSSEDVAIRNALYSMIGARDARRVLAYAYPGGSARGDIRRRVVLRAESGEIEGAATSAVIEEIVNELASFYEQQRAQEMAQRLS